MQLVRLDQVLGLAAAAIEDLVEPAIGPEEAGATLSYAAARGLRSVLVVTSPYHGRRALATFRQAFGASPVRVGIATASQESLLRPDRWWTSASDRWYVAYESAGILWYAVRYGVSPFVD